MSVCMCVFTSIGAHACTHVCIWRPEDNSQSCFLGAISILPLLKTGSLNSLRLAREPQNPSIHYPSAGIAGKYRYYTLSFYVDSGEQTCDFLITRQNLYGVRYLSDPSLFFHFLFSFFLNKDSSNICWTLVLNYVAECDLEHLILLPPLSPKCWNIGMSHNTWLFGTRD